MCDKSQCVTFFCTSPRKRVPNVTVYLVVYLKIFKIKNFNTLKFLKAHTVIQEGSPRTKTATSKRKNILFAPRHPFRNGISPSLSLPLSLWTLKTVPDVWNRENRPIGHVVKKKLLQYNSLDLTYWHYFFGYYLILGVNHQLLCPHPKKKKLTQ